MSEELKPCPLCERLETKIKVLQAKLDRVRMGDRGKIVQSCEYYQSQYLRAQNKLRIGPSVESITNAIEKLEYRLKLIRKDVRGILLESPEWSIDPPTEPGWYWVIFVGYPLCREIVYVFGEHDSSGMILFAQRPSMNVHYFQEAGRSVPLSEFTKIHTPLKWLKIEEPEVLK